MKTKIFVTSFVFLSFFGCQDKEKSSSLYLKANQSSENIHSISISGSSENLHSEYSSEQLDNTNGLSNSSINTIFQDSEKLLWIGTWDGLNRYDGTNFKIFRPELHNKNSLTNQVIVKIIEDAENQIWIQTIHGINRYNKKANTFQHYYFGRKNTPPLSESEFNITLDPAKKVFCAVKDWGIGYFDGADFQLLDVEKIPNKAVIKMQFTSKGQLLVLFENNELYALTIKNASNEKKTISKVALISNQIRSFEILSNQKLLTLSVPENAQLYSLESFKIIKPLTQNIEKIIGKVPQGIIVSNHSNYFIIDSSGNSTNENWLKHLNHHKTTTLIQGNENIIWTGTDGDGIFKISQHQKPFNLCAKEQVPELDGAIVRTFLEVKDHSFWVGTKGKGLFKFSSDFYQNPKKQAEYKNYNESNSGVNNAVYSLCKGLDNFIFIGTDGDGMAVYDIQKSKLIGWKDIIGHENADAFRSIYSIYQDEGGFIWIGTNGYGMIRCRIKRLGEKLEVSQFRQYRTDGKQANRLSSNNVFSIIPRNKNQLWVGTRLGGLNLFDKRTESFITYKNNENDPESLSNNDILCLQTDAKNRLWIGTSFGLNRLENTTKDGRAVFKNFTTIDGLPNNTIHGIIADQKNNLWISTNFGLSKFDLSNLKFSNYTQNDGLQNNEFADGAFYKNIDSEFVFMGGIKGFNYFMPQKLKESTVIPDLFIDQISGHNQPIPYYQGLVLSPDSTAFPSIVLDHNQNFFDIKLTALTYINTEKCQYAYQLTNFDKGWKTINNRKIISFTNVPKGNYSLWVKWSNADGVWSKPVHAIDIRVKPVFWQSNFAFILYLLFFAVFIYFVLSYYKKRQSLKQNISFRKKEKKLHENRLTFFTEIAHEFQTPLTLIVGPVQKLSEAENLNEKNQKFIKMIQRNSSRLLFLTQQLLEFRKAEYDHLEVTVKKFDLVNLIEQIAELFDEWALDKNIDYKLELPPALHGWFDKDKMEKIIFNLMSNAFKYTPINGRIRLKFEIQKTSKTIFITISNSGKGIKKEELESIFNQFFLGTTTKETDNNMFRTGVGLAYVKKIVTVLRGEISVSSILNQETTFTVILPCDKNSFSEKELKIDSSPILISTHLKNILEENPIKKVEIPDKISSLKTLTDSRKTILIVEDEKEIHHLLYEFLNTKYKLTIASNGLEALESIKNEIPDLIISDVMMPLMDGVALCKKIKNDIRTCHIPFIMLTAKDSVTHRIEGIESGANSYISKPFYPDHLLIRIKKLLEEKELISKHFEDDLLVKNVSSLPLNNDDRHFTKKVITLIRQNIDNENLQSLFIEKELGISNSQLYRKIKEIFGFTPGDLIRTIRLKYAAELLRKNKLTVSEVCYRSGFNNRSYFYREFKKLYQTTPKNYQLKL